MPDKEPDKYLEALRAEAYKFYQSRPDNDVWDDMVQFAQQCVERAVAEERKEIAARLRRCYRFDSNSYDIGKLERFITELETPEPNKIQGDDVDAGARVE